MLMQAEPKDHLSSQTARALHDPGESKHLVIYIFDTSKCEPRKACTTGCCGFASRGDISVSFFARMADLVFHDSRKTNETLKNAHARVLTHVRTKDRRSSSNLIRLPLLLRSPFIACALVSARRMRLRKL